MASRKQFLINKGGLHTRFAPLVSLKTSRSFPSSCHNLKICREAFKLLFIYVFIGCAGPVALHGLSIVVAIGSYSLVAMSRLLIMAASRCRAQALTWSGFSSCGVMAQLCHGT